MIYPEGSAITALLNDAQHILIIQADNPDADSLGSSLALEQLLGDQNKQVTMYCGIDIPSYLHYLNGWDRVIHDLPNQFNLSITVDASTLTLLDKLQAKNQIGWIAAKPSIVIDHHRTVENNLTFAKVIICDDTASSTGEIIYSLAKQLKWTINQPAGKCLMAAILGDTQGLSNELATAETHRIIAELIDLGVQRPLLESERREYGKMPPSIFKYKAQLIERTELVADDRIAWVSIPQSEINQFSSLYNPVPLIQGDMLQISKVAVAIVFKQYTDGRITAAIRSNLGFAIADQLAEKMGGGGHRYAAGFKITNGKSLDTVKQASLEICTQLLDKLNEDHK